MHIRSIRRTLPLLALILMVSGCSLPAPFAPRPTPTAVPTAVPTRRPKPTSVVPSATPVPDPHVNFSAISFTFDPSLGGAIGAQVPADTADNVGSPDWMLPDRVGFAVTGYPLPKSNYTPQIVVFPIAALPGFNDIGAQHVQALADLLKAKPDAAKIVDPIPQMSDPSEDEMFHAQVKYLDFQNGSGVRFIGQYSTDVRPVSNADLVYVFQGITDDGVYYVAVLLPLSQHDLISSEDAQTNSQADAMVNDFTTYLGDAVKDLNIAADSSFNPKLSLLDQVAGSFNVAPDALPAVTPAEPTRTPTPSGSQTPGGVVVTTWQCERLS